MAHESIIDLDADNFDTEVKQASVPVLVDFWAEWCGPCKMLGPILDEIAAEKGDTVKIAKVDVATHDKLAAEHGVTSIPLLLFFKDGEVQDRQMGIAPGVKDEIVKKLDALV